METTEWIDKALGLDALAGLCESSRHSIEDVFRAVGERSALADGEPLLQQGGIGGDAGYILIRGRAEITREGQPPLVLDAPALLGEMSQWNPYAQRTATVMCRGAVEALRFSWGDVYACARERLSSAEQLRLMEALERIALQRFHREDILDLPLLCGFPDEMRLRICILLQWVAHPLHLAAGEALFEADGLCDDMGYLLLKGGVRIVQSGAPPREAAAPALIGIHPQFNPELRWTATACAKSAAEALRFSWRGFLSLLSQRLNAAEMAQFQSAIVGVSASEALSR